MEIDYANFPEGIYFNMPFEDYLRIQALSSSGVKDLVVDEETFAHKCNWLNPDRVEDNTDAKDLGKMAHKYLLEPETFFDSYYFPPEVEDYPFLIRTADDAKNFLKSNGVAGLSKMKKPELLAQCRACDPQVPIWDYIVEDAAAANAGKIRIHRADYDAVVKMAAKIGEDEQLVNAFVDGYAEVVIVAKNEQGVLVKTRIDYLRTYAMFDLKSFAVRQNSIRPSYKQAQDTISNYGYFLQFAVYDDILHRALQKNLKFVDWLDQPLPPQAWLDELKANAGKPGGLGFVFVFVASNAPHQVFSGQMARRIIDGGEAHEYYKKGMDIYRSSSVKFKRCSESGVWKSDFRHFEVDDSDVSKVMYIEA